MKVTPRCANTAHLHQTPQARRILLRALHEELAIRNTDARVFSLCGRERAASAGELNRTGDAATCGHRPTHRRADEAGYTAAHQRCRSDRGRVQLHDCVDCGRTAQHWSYNHDDPDERLALGLSANPVAYSLNPEHYSPRCVKCHKRFDLGRTDSALVRD